MNLTRRNFIAGTATGLASLLAAPYIAKCGVLMPVRQLIKPNYLVNLEGSHDNKEWFLICRSLQQGKRLLDPKDYPLQIPYRFHRHVFVREWAA